MNEQECIGNQKENNLRTYRCCRISQLNYTQQIFNQYIKGSTKQLASRMFKTLHSDWLNLTLSYLTLQNNLQKVQILKSQAQYHKGDIIMEIRGSIINKQKLEGLIKQNYSIANFVQNTTCLLWGQNSSRTQVLVPKGISAQLLKKDPYYMQFLQRNQNKSNCVIQFQAGPKYLVEAETQINPGDALILNLNSLKKHIYHSELTIKHC